MRKINTRDFHHATRSMSREINRTIALNLLREHQPISRAELARLMNVKRSTVTALVAELLRDGAIYEGAFTAAPRGRRPQMLHVRTQDRLVVAVDVAFGRTHVQLADFNGKELATVSLATEPEPAVLADAVARAARALLQAHASAGECEGLGLVVPGMVDRRSGRIVNSPALGWRDVDLREMVAARVGMRAFIENAPIACAMARMWLKPPGAERAENCAYLMVSDGVGAGVLVDGSVLRGHNDTAGEFGHLPLNVEGPRCMCGLRGCLEAYTSTLATVGRYLRLDPAEPADREALRRSGLTVQELVTRARDGDERARATLHETARCLGLGIAGIVTALNPSCVFVDGELVTGWEMLGPTVVAAARSRALTPAAAATPIHPVSDGAGLRLLGATSLLVARQYAAPRVA